MTSNGLGDGSYSPYRTISEATRCVCGHRWDGHLTSPGNPCQTVMREDGPDHVEWCQCFSFEPDDEDR